jgi:NTE family protein
MAETHRPQHALAPRDDLAIVLDGGGARAAYQVGLLRAIARWYPNLRIPLITGVSAGAINAVFLATRPCAFGDAIESLVRLWSRLTVERVFRVDSRSLSSNVWHWGLGLVSGGRMVRPPLRGLLDTSPLRETLEQALEPNDDGTLPGIARNLHSDALVALAIVTHSYTTGRTVAWVEGRDVQDWERPFRHSRLAPITVGHVLASASRPLLFPSTHLGEHWYGDGGIRLVTPLSPAVHLGANRILACSTRYSRGRDADTVQTYGYPPPMQIAGQLLNAIFLDDHDRDALTLERVNVLLRHVQAGEEHGYRPIDLVFIRPSRDIGKLAAGYEPKLPGLFRHLLGGLGSRETSSPDLLSLLAFQPDYLRALIEIGEADGEANRDAIARLVERP